MTTLQRSRSKKVGSALLAALALAVLLNPGSALAAQRDGTVLFFSWEDLKQLLTNPIPVTQVSSLSWYNAPKQSDQETPVERNYRWGNGLGVDSYAYPGTRMPLWGY